MHYGKLYVRLFHFTVFELLNASNHILTAAYVQTGRPIVTYSTLSHQSVRWCICDTVKSLNDIVVYPRRNIANV